MALPAMVVLTLAAGAGCASPGTKPAAASSAAASTATPAVDPNVRPCASVEASIQQLRAPLAGWMPTAKPFDKKVATLLHKAATDIQGQEETASGPAKLAIHDWAAVLMALSNAMQGKDASAVKAAAAKVRTPFVQLRKVCKFEH